jgi:hypothetical protein
MSEHRIFSFGGGVQSHAVLALAAAGKVNYEAFVFANVGADSENPETLDYIEKVTRPYCAAHGLAFVEVQRLNRAGQPISLRQEVMRPERRSVVIPAYADGGGPTNRNCTNDWKIAVIDRWVRQQGYERVVIGLGISTDEWLRARDGEWHDAHTTQSGNRRPFGFWKRREYPLLQLNINRAMAHRVIADAGLPPVPKSACYFCPFKRPNEWTELKATRPDLFEKAAELEDAINAKGLPKHYTISAMKRPLREAVGDQGLLWPADDSCDSGYCWT